MVKWDATTDQILLLKILETSQVNADVKAIADAWPDGLDKPTPRAITERLVKIRKDVKSNGVNTHFSVSSAKQGASTNTPTITPSKAATPQKRAPRGSKSGSVPSSARKNGNGNKRPRAGKDYQSDEDDESADDLSRTVMPGSENFEEGPSRKKAKNGNDVDGKVKVEEEFAVEEYGQGFGVEGFGYQGSFGGDGAGDYGDGAIFA